MLGIHHATDRRVYNGALCSDMAAERKSFADAWKTLLQLEPRLVCTYFPAPGPDYGYLVSIKHETDTRLYFDVVSHSADKATAFEMAYEVLTERNKQKGTNEESKEQVVLATKETRKQAGRNLPGNEKAGSTFHTGAENTGG